MKEETRTQRNIECWPRITSLKLVKAENWIPARLVNSKNPSFYYATLENEDATSPGYTFQKPDDSRLIHTLLCIHTWPGLSTRVQSHSTNSGCFFFFLIQSLLTSIVNETLKIFLPTSQKNHSTFQEIFFFRLDNVSADIP